MLPAGHCLYGALSPRVAYRAWVAILVGALVSLFLSQQGGGNMFLPLRVKRMKNYIYEYLSCNELLMSVSQYLETP